MHENPYQTAEVFVAPPQESSAPRAGFAMRFVAYLIDILPLTLGVAGVYYLFFGFRETLAHYFDGLGDIEARMAFLRQRNQIQNITFFTYIIYSSLMEASSLQATLGKKLLGLRVTDMHGNQLSLAQSLGRNFSKLISSLPCALGFLWVIWSPSKQTWHDMIAKAVVVR